jgi:flagellar protein FlgJ
MDISSLTAVNAFNQAYNPFSSSSTEAANVLYSETAFEELLRKTQASATQLPTQTQSQTSFLPAKEAPIDKNSELYEMCVELETCLLKNLIKSMRGTIQKTKLIDTGFAGEMYEDMLYDEYAKSFAKNANLGFAEMAYRDLARYL